MAARITIIGGGSYHWAPRLLSDFANTPALQDAEVVLHDIDAVEAPAHGRARRRDRAAARHPADGHERRPTASARSRAREFVIACLSVGGFESMKHDLEIPEAHGMRQPIGDTVGPGGVMRALRSVPVVLDIARDIEAVVSRRAVPQRLEPADRACAARSPRETKVQTVGLCNELVGMQWMTSLAARRRHAEDRPEGRRREPPPARHRAARRRRCAMRFAQLRELLDDPDRAASRDHLDGHPPAAVEYEKITPGERWHKADVIHNNRVRLELFHRFGVLPGSGDHHVAEFFPGFVTPENDYGSDWKVHIYGLRKHMADADDDVTHYEAVRDDDEMSRFPSGELVAPLLEAMLTGVRRDLPVNLPNRGHVTNLPDGVVVEAMGTIDADGVRAARRRRGAVDARRVPPPGRGVAGAHRRRRTHR